MANLFHVISHAVTVYVEIAFIFSALLLIIY